jgi:Cdc6-like AAA superfamily ATPase
VTSPDDNRGSALNRYTTLARVFTPNSPVSHRELFRGRLEQVFQVSAALSQPGQHIVVYGERGVGKTSFANLLSVLVAPDEGEADPSADMSVRINCTTQDTFRTMWSKVCRELRVDPANYWQGSSPDPDDIRFMLAALPAPRLLILDEFDRVEDDESLSLMSDTIKALSDHVVPTKLVIVGVADSLDQLIGEHESVQRALEEVQMPRMKADEILELVDKGFSEAGMTISHAARFRLVRLCEGLPHYAHLLSLNAGQHALLDDRNEVEIADIDRAVENAVKRHSLLRTYQVAIQSSRRETLYSRVLAACALADKNRLGYFTTGAVRDPLSRIMGRRYEIQAFAPHLDAFCGVTRGSILKKEGPQRRYTYRFRDPLLQPFAVFAGLAEGIFPEEYREELFG